MNVKKYIIRNSRRSLLTLFGITLSSVLLISIGILFSSFRDYLITSVKTEIGDYHVMIKGKINRNSTVEKIKYKDERYHITYKNIYNTYQNTEKICKDKRCETVTYNTDLLSLYGVSKDKNTLNIIKKVMYFMIISLSIILFFIIYNSFKVSLNNRRRDICLLKLAGCTNGDIYKLFIKEAGILCILGTIIGLIISLLINYALINTINEKLSELFKGNLHLKIYFSFVIVPIIFTILIVILSAILPLKNAKNFKVMELFRISEKTEQIKVPLLKNFTLWLSITNYIRQREKYKSLILCVFISCLAVSTFTIILNYGLKSLKDFVIMPKYDLKITMEEDYDFKKIAEDLDSKKYIIYKSCQKVGKIEKENYIKDYKEEEEIMFTNLGKNELINIVNKIEKNKKITHLNYKKFKKIDTITLDNTKLENIKLTDKIPLGFDEIDNIVINLDDDNFSNVCETYQKSLILKTNFQSMDEYLDDLIKTKELNMTYINVKKARQITENIISTIKIILYAVCLMIILIMTLSAVSIASASTNYRRRELARLKSIGLESKRIIISLMLESLIISFKGWFYALPFVLIINKYIYLSITEVFVFGKMILGLDIIVVNFILVFIIITLSIIISYKSSRDSIIKNIRK